MTSKSKSTSFLARFLSVPRVFVTVSVVLLLLCPTPDKAQAPPRPQRNSDKAAAAPLPATSSEIERGKYIVNNVAMCPQCHSPRDANGAVDQRHFLEGAAELFQPPYHDPNWPLKAPRIGGNPPASDQDMIKLLTTGVWTDGKPLRLPMMPFRMSDADAKAVLAYLKSVKTEH